MNTSIRRNMGSQAGGTKCNGTRKARRLLWTAVGVTLGMSGGLEHQALGATKTNTVGGNWSTGANWGGTKPANGDAASFLPNSASNLTLTLDTSYSGTGLLTLNIDPFGNGDANFAQSGFTMIAATENISVGNDVGTARYNQSGGINNATTLNIANGAGGKGIYTLSGTAVSTVTTLTLATGAGSQDTYHWSRGILDLSNRFPTVGQSGTGTFNPSGTGNLTVSGGARFVNLAGGLRRVISVVSALNLMN